MAEVGRQQRESSLRVLTRSVPLHESVWRESVTHIVQARATTAGWVSETDLPRQCMECLINLHSTQAVARAGNEQIGRHRSPCPMALTSFDIVVKHCAGRGVQGHQTALAEL